MNFAVIILGRKLIKNLNLKNIIFTSAMQFILFAIEGGENSKVKIARYK